MTAKVAVIGIVVVLGIITFVAGFAAEITRIKASEVYIGRFTSTCVHKSSRAARLAILAAVCAIITRIILLFATGCCGRPSVINFLSWITSLVGVILLFAGVLLINPKGVQQRYNGRLTCYIVKRGIFIVGSIFSVFGTFFGIVAYIIVSSSTQTSSQLDIEIPVANEVDVERSSEHPQIIWKKNHGV